MTTNAPETRQLTRIQIERAHKLAFSHNHTWGQFCPADGYVSHPSYADPAVADFVRTRVEGYRELLECKTVDEIRELVHRRLEAGPCGWGIDAPGSQIDQWGDTCLAHVTGTGRLSWRISPDGSVELRVHRPSGPYISLSFDSDIDDFCSVGVTDAYGYEKARIYSGDDWAGRRLYHPAFLQFNNRHVTVLFEAHAALTDGAQTPAELVALRELVRPDGIIVSRHPAAVDFIRDNVADSSAFPLLEHATAENVLGQRVYGNIPLHLAALAESVTVVEFRGDPPRGTEYGEAEMKAAGARLRTYKVQSTGGGYGRY